MPKIVFSVLSTPEQRSEIGEEFRRLLAANADVLTADLEVRTDVAADPSLEGVWRDYGFLDLTSEAPEPAAFVFDVQKYEGSISGLSMRLSEVLTEREKQPAEQLFQQILDDPGRPRVPWHVDVRP
ncbi:MULTISPECIES: hypothetical protein [Corynebacterium]|jgi:hypothetical protein|uniref:Uncharacterized protein n=1 Tax=Corynebacterium provencense TaxID=1737425 RepID=A0A2Z3YPC3_9CORY|nr:MULTISPECIES: hypothetical protein [Corynebacterium]AWT26376.1 hypothetical protein Csp1_15920 [Corynebacterium provencense]MCI1256540.1 hypothetical protein [Corynebacterium provencense]